MAQYFSGWPEFLSLQLILTTQRRAFVDILIRKDLVNTSNKYSLLKIFLKTRTTYIKEHVTTRTS